MNQELAPVQCADVADRRAIYLSSAIVERGEIGMCLHAD